MDPLLSGDVGLAAVLIVLLKVVVAFAVLLIGVMAMVWFERKLIADMQNRIGPNRAGPWGLLQTLADGIKLFFKEDSKPDSADLTVFKLAPYLSLVPAFLTFAIIPVAGNFMDGGTGTIELFGHTTYAQLADPPIGILLALAMSSVAVYGVMLAGWSSGSKYPLLGSVRASAQMVSYEAALGLAVLAVVLTAGTLSVNGIVSEQSTWGWNLWVTGLIPFVIFCLASTAELNRPPFDLVEAEQELVGSFQTEYSGFRFAIFYLAEFLNAITMAAIIVTLFLGGPNGPDLPVLPGWLWGFVFFFAKIIVILYVFVWVRASVPRVRYDQLMDLGWKLLIPLGLGWLLLLVAMRVASDEGWGFGGMLATAAAGVGIMAVCYGMLLLAMRIARRNRQLEGVID